MDEILDFGAGWQPSDIWNEDNTSSPPLKDEEHKKLTIKEQRVSDLHLIASYIKQQDVENLSSFIKDNPMFKMGNSLYDFTDLALINFNADVMDILLDGDVEPSIYRLFTKIEELGSIDILDYFIRRSKVESVKNNNYILSDDYTRSFEWYEKERYEFQVKHNPSPNWSFLYRNILSGANISSNDFGAKVINYIDENYVDVKYNNLVYDDLLFNLIKNPPSPSSWTRDYLSRVPAKAWENTFKKFFSDPIYFKQNEDTFTIENLSFLVSFLKEDKNKEIKKIWNKVQSLMRDQHNDWEKWFDKYLPQNLPIEETPLMQMMPNLDYSKFHRELYDEPANFGSNFVKKYFYKVGTQTQLSVNAKSSGLSESSYISLYPSYFFLNANFEKLEIKNKSINQAPISNPPRYMPPSFIHTLVCSASPILTSLLGKEDSKLAIKKCFESSSTAYFFARNADIATFKFVIRSIPSLLHYKDYDGNSLAYTHVVTRFDKTKASALTLLGLSHNWFLESNKNGDTLLDAFKNNGLSPKFFVELEKKIITTAMKDDDLTATKLRSRTKYSAPKRKI